MTVATAAGVQFAAGQPYFDNILTNYFVGLIADARNNSCVLYNLIQKVGHQPVSGRFIVFPVRFGRNTGRGSIRKGGDLPDPGRQGSRSYSLESRLYYGRVKIDGDTFRRGQTDGGAFATALDMEMQGQSDDICIELNRQLHNDGSGRMAEVAVTAASTTTTVRVNSNIEGATTTVGMADRYFEVGDRVAFTAPAGTRRATGGGVTAFFVVAVLSSTQIQVSATEGGAALDVNTAASVVAGDWIVRASNQADTLADSTGFRSECMGLAGIFHEDGVLDGNGPAGLQHTGSTNFTNTDVTHATLGVFQGLTANTVNPFNRAVVLDGGGVARPNSEALMQQALSDAEERNNAEVKLFLSAYPAYNQYVSQLTPDKRYNDTLDLKGGHKVISFNGIPWVKDRYCYKNRVYMLDPDMLTMFEVAPLGPLTAQGVPMWDRLQDKDAYWTGVVGDHNLATPVRNKTGAVLVDLTA